MKIATIILALLFTSQGFAFDVNSNKMASDEVLKEALEKPRKYTIDDGGNISFGNGFFKRRFNFAGQPQACHFKNVLYAGTAKKCVKGQENEGHGGYRNCTEYKEYQLQTPMVGTRQVCVGNTKGGTCSKWATVKFKRGPRVKVAIYRSAQMNDHQPSSGFLGFNYLTLPACDGGDF